MEGSMEGSMEHSMEGSMEGSMEASMLVIRSAMWVCCRACVRVCVRAQRFHLTYLQICAQAYECACVHTWLTISTGPRSGLYLCTFVHCALVHLCIYASVHFVHFLWRNVRRAAWHVVCGVARYAYSVTLLASAVMRPGANSARLISVAAVNLPCVQACMHACTSEQDGAVCCRHLPCTTW